MGRPYGNYGMDGKPTFSFLTLAQSPFARSPALLPDHLVEEARMRRRGGGGGGGLSSFMQDLMDTSEQSAKRQLSPIHTALGFNMPINPMFRMWG